MDMDTTCDPVHGNQEKTGYNGYYGTDCYTPLLMHSEGFPLVARLRPGKAGRADDGLKMLKRVHTRLKGMGKHQILVSCRQWLCCAWNLQILRARRHYLPDLLRRHLGN